MSDKKKILVIDDDEDICIFVQNILSNDFHVDFVQSGKEGIEKLKTKSYDLILLDIMMPEMNGYEVCEKIKEEVGNVLIIFLSAKDTVADMILGFKKGAARYVTKPINSKELIHEIKTTLKIP